MGQARSFNFINSAPTKYPYPYDLQQQSNTHHLHFLPTPAPKSPSTSLRSVPSQRNSKINKRFLNIDENYQNQLRQNHKPVQDDFKENDLEKSIGKRSQHLCHSTSTTQV